LSNRYVSSDSGVVEPSTFSAISATYVTTSDDEDGCKLLYKPKDLKLKWSNVGVL
jgi:hypothetical protein